MLNATQLMQNPLKEILSPFTSSLLGQFFYAIVFLFIVGAVYIKTRNLTPTMAMMAMIGSLFSSILTASGAGLAVLILFYVFTGIGIAGLVASVFLR